MATETQEIKLDLMDVTPDEAMDLPEGLIVLHGLHEAVLGIDEEEQGLIYSITAIIAVLMQRDGMTAEEADEFFAFNILPLGQQDGGPIFLRELDAEVLTELRKISNNPSF